MARTASVSFSEEEWKEIEKFLEEKKINTNQLLKQDDVQLTPPEQLHIALQLFTIIAAIDVSPMSALRVAAKFLLIAGDLVGCPNS